MVQARRLGLDLGSPRTAAAAVSGWSGGAANRTWQRDARSADSGRIGVIEDVRAILAKFRAEHGYEAGMVWDPQLGQYRWPQGQVRV